MSVDTTNATAAAGVDPRLKVAGSIKQAASAIGASFEYLLTTAKMESNFNPKAGATTSSAHGLFQFIDQTWLGTVKEAGSQLGYGKYADAITKDPSGGYSVSDPSARASIMKLRDDPDAASSMAAVLTQSNSFKLTGKIGRRPTDAELYMAHFMGVGGAAKLISNAEDNPQASAVRMFPNAAEANRSIFYDRTGQARSVSQVYSVLTSRYTAAANSSDTRTAFAAFGGDPQKRVAVASAVDRHRRVSFELSGFARRDAGGSDIADRLGATRSDLPLAVPGRRSHPADFAGGAGIVGQFFVADVGSICDICAIPFRTDTRGSSSGPVGSVQRPQRHVQQLTSLACPCPGP
jgi:Transglycosylase SLT domain